MKYIHEERMEVNARGLAHLCMYCEANPVKTSGGDICTDDECMTRWNSDYARGRREVAKAKRKEVRSAQCACPCKRAFTTTIPARRFFSTKCGRTFHAERRKREATARVPQPRKSGPAILFGKGRAFLGRAYAEG